jgi:hypothetical protein
VFNSAIIRMTAGPINQINDAVVGMPAAPLGPGVSKFAGQLGAGIYLDDANILYNSAVGTVYGGHFRYVRLAAAATAVVVGQIVFWDLTVANNLYQVTTSEAGSATGATLAAGIVLNNKWTAGNYSVIQDIGDCFVQFRGTLTGASAAGAGVYCAGAGTGVDNGFADVQTQSTTITDIMLQRFLGTAKGTPTNGSLTLVSLKMVNQNF